MSSSPFKPFYPDGRTDDVIANRQTVKSQLSFKATKIVVVVLKLHLNKYLAKVILNVATRDEVGKCDNDDGCNHFPCPLINQASPHIIQTRGAEIF